MANESNKTLVSKLAHICGELGKMDRKGYNDFHRYSYFTEDQLTAALRPHLAAQGLFILTSVTNLTQTTFKNQKGNEERLVTVSTSHVIHDGETGETLIATGVGMGADAGDKGAYKAVTGAMKYFLMKNFLISDNEDPEADVAADRARTEKHSPTAPKEKATRDTPTAQADLATLTNWAKENGVATAFILELAAEGKMAKNETTLDELKPGTLSRLLALRERILARWKIKTEGVNPGPDANVPSKSTERKAATKAPPKESKASVQYEGQRVPIDPSIDPEKYLEGHGLEWGEVPIHFGSKKDTKLNALEDESLAWWVSTWKPKQFKGKFSPGDLLLDAALCVAQTTLPKGD